MFNSKISVYYDYHDDQLVPQKMVIYFGSGNIDWDESTLYIPIDTPFEAKHAEDFGFYGDVLGIAIVQGELIISAEKPDCFGVHLPTVKQRLNKIRPDSMAFTLDDIEQFILQIGDIEEILQMSSKEYFVWKE